MAPACILASLDTHRDDTGVTLDAPLTIRLKGLWFGAMCSESGRIFSKLFMPTSVSTLTAAYVTELVIFSSQMIICSHYSLKLCGILIPSIRISKNLYHSVKSIGMCFTVPDSWKVVLTGFCFQLASKLLGARVWLPVSPGRHSGTF